ncbi:Rpp14/Pop5 family protein [Methanococcus voltae]|uniref:Ribonuclease P protein component 2 n=2 Tax=Methanococcus voltae TaxID=2188 RepID=A0A8J7RHB9_METVO|nr:Rpp14/Pop5 family protein [Methanococcus voltae]MBP2172588.1 ribonuclease P/MRP protein subunit POP5 [Methanococcus voltae]MBP2201505.1 ribonuclease P/MRP protein subunit POP5 [Methanococcus voltae]MCS3922294.1 ribonuclease P/MRP protein subunit POP5 [Methanococcus voltae PS]
MLKTLPPTLREKKRYLAFEILHKEELSNDDVIGIIRSSIIDYCGFKECGIANPWLIDYSNGMGILRVERTQVDNVKASLIMVGHYKRNPINIRVMGISNSIKNIRKKFLHVPHEPYYKIIQRKKREYQNKNNRK